ncbi:hypothetical protein [Saccharibacillus brassicae]|uniref:Uncharacterized protein n=1 Tax=Saccharibacillus brassicae TaxID=2583377 RepID=A0A4Y6URF2_SACBS|nr:hypothetical protein [Saccharibacillus brassicae]QDH20199.1 hypothetical protein FFV09_04590 [Saccharibacillus brassicae]
MGYVLGEELNRHLVRGIESGYNTYALERSEKRQSMRVSAAYAWVKGNHIDDQVSRELEKLGADFRDDKAGYTWSYLQFSIPDSKSLLLIKNATILKSSKKLPELDVKNPDNYLIELSQINSKINFEELKPELQGVMKFDEIIQSSLKEVQKQAKLSEFDRFYIATYEIEPKSRMLSNVSLWMPEFKEGNRVEMVLIDDLSPHLGKTGIEMDVEAIGALSSMPEAEYSGEVEEYGYSIVSKKAEENA